MDANKPKHNYEQIRQIINERISLMDEKTASTNSSLSDGQRQVQQIKSKARNAGGLWQRLRSLMHGSGRSNITNNPY
jgi:hypothetical protein